MDQPDDVPQIILRKLKEARPEAKWSVAQGSSLRPSGYAGQVALGC